MADEFSVTHDVFLAEAPEISSEKGLVVYTNVVDGVRYRRWQTRHDFFVAHSRAQRLVDQLTEEDRREVKAIG